MSSTARQVSNAINFIIHGALRQDENCLKEVLDAIIREVNDWAENGNAADDNVNIALSAPWSPYNLAKAIEELLKEAVNLKGHEYGRVILRDCRDLIDIDQVASMAD